MVVAVWDWPDATDANLRVGAAWARLSANVILGPVPASAGPALARISAADDVDLDAMMSDHNQNSPSQPQHSITTVNKKR